MIKTLLFGFPFLDKAHVDMWIQKSKSFKSHDPYLFQTLLVLIRNQFTLMGF